MAKIHELLAVEANLKGQANATRLELQNTFEKKKHHFSQSIQTFQPFEEGKPAITESVLDLQTTVAKEIKWLSTFLIKAIDAGHQVNVGNTIARADVVLEDGTTLLEDIPSIALLEMEKRMKELQDFINTIPTLDPAKGFDLDKSQGEGVYAARETMKVRTRKIKKIYTLSPATDKFPAQVQLIDEDEPVGTITTREWSGLLTVADKGEYLERTENIIRALKKARSRANDKEIDTDKTRVGAKLLGFVFSK
jgi:hypothetical protein